MGHIYTMLVVIIAWVIFRSDNIAGAVYFLKNMFGMKNRVIDNTFLIYLNSYKWYLLIGLAAALPLRDKVYKWWERCEYKQIRIAWNIIYVTGMLFLIIADIATIVKGSYNPFIYFNF